MTASLVTGRTNHGDEGDDQISGGGDGDTILGGAGQDNLKGDKDVICSMAG